MSGCRGRRQIALEGRSASLFKESDVDGGRKHERGFRSFPNTRGVSKPTLDTRYTSGPDVTPY